MEQKSTEARLLDAILRESEEEFDRKEKTTNTETRSMAKVKLTKVMKCAYHNSSQPVMTRNPGPHNLCLKRKRKEMEDVKRRLFWLSNAKLPYAAQAKLLEGKGNKNEHHLQRAICSGTTIPTPDVFTLDDFTYYGKLYTDDYKFPRQLIYMQPFSMEVDIPDYDMDSDDEQWIGSQSVKLELTPDKFEEMMDRLEKGSGQTVVTLQEAKALIKEDDDLIIAVYDYWLNKRLKLQHSLIPQVKTEARIGIPNHNPYIAFRRRTEKMQTRKNRKNDESSYEKMLKLKRDLSRAVTLLEMVKRREKSKRELLHLSIEVFEKRYQVGDFTGQLVNDALSQRLVRPAFTPLYQANNANWMKEDLSNMSRKEKRQYKKRRHKSASKTPLNAASGSGNGPFSSTPNLGFPQEGDYSSDEEAAPHVSPSEGDEEEDEGAFPFRRRVDCDYLPPLSLDSDGSPSRCSTEEVGQLDNKYQFFPTSVSKPSRSSGYRNVGYARRRIGRGGRVILDRTFSRTGDTDDFWRSVGYEVYDSHQMNSDQGSTENLSVSSSYPPEPDYSTLPVPAASPGPSSSSNNLPHFRPKSPPSEEPVAGPSGLCRVNEEESEEISESSDGEEDLMDLGQVRMGMILGTVTSRGDKPLIFNIANLLKDPTPHALQGTPSLSLDSDEPPGSTGLLDKTSADLCNMHCIEMELEPKPEMESWYTAADLPGGVEMASPLNFELIDLESDVPTITLDTESDPNFQTPATVPVSEEGGSEVTTHVNSSEVSENMDTDSDPAPSVSVTGEVLLLESDLERRRLLDKTNKENDRKPMSAKRDRVGSSQAEDEDEERVVENGDASSLIDPNEECMIVEEQKPIYFTPKSWSLEIPHRA